jgi:uncharacterized protein YdeI (YjbR/CyaY-like superfamily)
MRAADAEQLLIESVSAWHEWLADHHQRSTGVWVVLWRPTTGRPRPSYDELIREALCWGWIDGQSKPLDDQRSMLWFTARKPTSVWSATNKARVAELAAAERLQPAGLAQIEQAKADGRWTLLESAEALIEPDELADALNADPLARRYWDGLTPGVRKQALSWIAIAKRPQTRASRIAEIAARAGRGERPI